jgi:hypothetical protein
MANKTDQELILEASVIRNETQNKANTAIRVGNMFLDLIGSKANKNLIIPTPIISIDKSQINNNQQLRVSFNDSDFDFSKGNPEIFLMRYKNSGRKIIKTILNPIGERRQYKAKFVHPTTEGSDMKWNGWKFFNGKQSIFRGVWNIPVTGRVTEWTIPLNILPYQQFIVPFNIYMFWTQQDFINNTAQYDQNFFTNFAEYSTTDPVSIIDPNLFVRIGNSQRSRDRPTYSKTQKYALVVAVDNPLATKTNGLCPKIFGPLSEEFYSVLKIESFKPIDIILEKRQMTKSAHLKRPVLIAP